MSCSIQAESVFGPQVAEECRGGFDFTLLFEELILAIVPLAIVCCFMPFRIWRLLRESEKARISSIHHWKLFASVTYMAFQWALLVLLCIPDAGVPKTQATIPTTALTLALSIGFVLLSHLEHTRNVRPSSTLVIFHGFTLLFDAIRTRTIWALPNNHIYSIFFSASVGFKLIITILESVEKNHCLQRTYEKIPRETTSGVFNRNVFWWLYPLLGSGFSKNIELENLPLIDDRLNSPELQNALQIKWNSLNPKHPHSLLWLLFSHYKWQVLAAVIPRLCLSGFTFAQPFLFKRVVEFISEKKHRNSDNYGYGLIAAALIIYLGIAVTIANNQHKTYRVITMIRGSLVSLIFTGTLPLSTAAVKESAAVTLMSADVERVGSGMRNMQEVWASPVDFALAFFLLQRELGVASVAPAAVFLLCSIGGLAVGASMASRQRHWLEAIQKRVKITADMLGSMKEVRMAGLQARLKAELQYLREEEIKASGGFKNALIYIVTLSYLTIALAPVIAFTMFSLLAKKNGQPPLDTARAFTALTIFALLKGPMALIIDSIAGFVSAIGSIQRIGEYLSTSEKSSRYGNTELMTSETVRSVRHSTQSEKTASLDDRLASWAEYHSQGPDMIVATQASAGWEKDKPFVIKDLNFKIQRGTSTYIIGPVGSGKSTLLRAILGETATRGGEITTAFSEAAFCSQTPWITNDTIRSNILGTSLYDKMWYEKVIEACAISQDLDQYPNGDQEVTGSRGINLSGGQQARLALARAVYSKKRVILLDDVMSGLDSRTEEILFENLFGEQGLFKRLGATVIFATNAVRRVSYADHIIVLSRNGEIEEQGSLSQLSSDPERENQITGHSKDDSSKDESVPPSVGGPMAEIQLSAPADAINRRTGDTTVYKYYVTSVGVWNSIIFMLLCSSFVFALVFPQYLVRWWTDENARHPNHNLGYYLGGYLGLGGLTIASLILACWHLVAHIMTRASTKFHDTLLETTLNAPLSLFSETDIGTTTNRFSQDLELIDMELPVSLFNTSVEFLSCLAQLIILAISAKYFGAMLPFLIAIFYAIQKFYLRTARQLRLLDIEAKAPLFSRFLEALEGLVTIRAFGWQKDFERLNTEAIDVSQRPYYLLYCVQRWLNFVLDVVVTAIAFVVVTVAVQTKGNIEPGLIGIALVNIVNFSSSIKNLISNWTILETSIGAVSRVRSFEEETESEHSHSGNDTPPPEWPSAGGIEFRGITASYKSSSNPVIKNLSMTIAPGQKLAICGQSGSGKSSIISTLLRLLDVSEGSIFIDGLDISLLSRHDVRSRLICVTQTPYLLPDETVRNNVDPFNTATDDEILSALEEVRLSETVDDLGGLDAILDQDALSVGERQLICLARAMVRKGTILILDEATASVDVKTDELMQNIIRTHFAKHTVIAIAHRLNTIVDFDRVAVISKGELIEYDSPKILLGQPSAFREAYEKSSHGRVDEATSESTSSLRAPSESTLVSPATPRAESPSDLEPLLRRPSTVSRDEELEHWPDSSEALVRGPDESRSRDVTLPL